MFTKDAPFKTSLIFLYGCYIFNNYSVSFCSKLLMKMNISLADFDEMSKKRSIKFNMTTTLRIEYYKIPIKILVIV